MKERFAALPTRVLVLAGVFQATRGLGGDEASVTGSAAASKLAQAERVVVYGLTTTGGPRFRLSAALGVRAAYLTGAWVELSDAGCRRVILSKRAARRHCR